MSESALSVVGKGPARAAYKVGSVVEQRTFGGGTRLVRVTAVEADVKNGRPGFDGVSAGESVWGYDEQIVAVNGLVGYGATGRA